MEYASSLEKNGYDDLEFLKTRTEAQLLEIGQSVGMPIGHSQKFAFSIHQKGSIRSFAAAMKACDALGPSSSTEYEHSFYDRDEIMAEVMSQVVKFNFKNRGKTDHNMHTFVVVPGGSGIGKSRFGYEIGNQIANSGGAGGIFNDCPIVTKYVGIDFNNGERFDAKFDMSAAANLRLGVRLAAQGLMHKSFEEIVQGPSPIYSAFKARSVLERIVADALNAPENDEAVVCIVLHLDEFQAYVDAFPKSVDGFAGHDYLNDILRQVGDLMRTGLKSTEYHKRFFLVPVLTGTAENDIRIVKTDKYKLYTVMLDNLQKVSALNMYDDKFIINADQHKERSKGVRSSNHFRVALTDTGYVPRIIAHLLNLEKNEVRMNTPWGDILDNYENPKRGLKLSQLGGPDAAEAIIHLALSAQAVEPEFMLPGGTTVGELQRKGEILLKESYDNSKFYIHLPFVQLKAINLLLIGHRKIGAFDQSLLFSPSMARPWRYQDFEVLHGHFLALKVKALICVQQNKIDNARVTAESQSVELSKSEQNVYKRASYTLKHCQKRLQHLEVERTEGFELQEVFRGVLGHKDTLGLRVNLQPMTCFQETTKWISKKDELAPVTTTVECKEERDRVSLFDGVFLHAYGTAIFDGRFGLKATKSTHKPVLVVWQAKHSGLDTKKPVVSASNIHEWHSEAESALVEWQDEYDVVYTFLTNRKLTNRPDLELPKGILVVTRDELSDYMSSTLAGRGLIPLDTDNNDAARH